MAHDRWWLVAGAGLAVFMASVDQSIVNVALPVIGRDFDVPASVTEWIVLGYLLPLVALTLPSGRWLDGVGQRAALCGSAAGFAVASTVAGLAPGIGWLIAARAVQGVFGAVFLALVPAMITVAVRAEVRGRAMGLVTTMGTLGLICGPTIGGVLVDDLGWRWIYYVNVPASLLIIATAVTQLPDGGAMRAPDRSLAVEGAMLGGAVTVLMLGLSLVTSGLAWLLLTLPAAPLMLAWLRTPASTTVRHLVGAPGEAGPHLGLAATATATGLLFFVVPFYLIQVRHMSAATAGLTVLAFPLGMALGGPAGGVMTDWTGARRTAIAGAGLYTAGLLLLVPLIRSWSPPDFAWRLALAGLGVGLFNAPNMTLAMSCAPRRLLATAGATTSVARQGGFALGPALATVIWALTGYAVNGIRGAIALGSTLTALGVMALVRSQAPTTHELTGEREDGFPHRELEERS
jgi:MFS family permease